MGWRAITAAWQVTFMSNIQHNELYYDAIGATVIYTYFNFGHKPMPVGNSRRVCVVSTHCTNAQCVRVGQGSRPVSELAFVSLYIYKEIIYDRDGGQTWRSNAPASVQSEATASYHRTKVFQHNAMFHGSKHEGRNLSTFTLKNIHWLVSENGWWALNCTGNLSFPPYTSKNSGPGLAHLRTQSSWCKLCILCFHALG